MSKIKKAGKGKITVRDIAAMKERGEKFAVLTAYSFQIAALLDSAGVELFIVGDSVGMVEAGYSTTLPVTMDEIVYHTRAVARASSRALVVADMPFGSYQTGVGAARENAVRLVKEGGAEAVKVEGGRRTAEAIRAIVDMDVPVMGHVGLTPQSVHKMGGYRIQGRTRAGHEDTLADARAVEEAGAFAIVLEGIPVALAKEITESLSIPTIGIGAGPHCDAQVLVVNDMLGISAGAQAPKFVKKYADLDTIITRAVKTYVKEVKTGKFPTRRHSY
ncbi:MAG: 3-methyl-2-oxobutanoate hydroxymethyltransferase [Proteobacteria bacterium]|nr:3-methyl-2-oxobutanoate hydroxymethyltransferase [Pseudomonadota bacterium]